MELCKSEGIKQGSVTAIGAINKVTLGLFNSVKKHYYRHTIEGEMEISSLIGNISTMNGESYLHLHINVSDVEYKTHGGHLNEAWVSCTCEMIVDVIDGEIDREFSDEIGLNLYKF